MILVDCLKDISARFVGRRLYVIIANKTPAFLLIKTIKGGRTNHGNNKYANE